MNWQDRLNNIIFSILTGDGKLYQPDWKNGESSKDFNATEFEFINQPGALIDRKRVKAESFPLTFWFQGEDCIDQTNAFFNSANDSRAWIVHHPFYGEITGQPIRISRDDSLYNSTQVNVDFKESISTTFPISKIPIADGTDTKTDKFHTISPTEYAAKVKPKAIDKTKMADSLTSIDALTNKILTTVYYNDYQALKSTAFAAVDKLIDYPAAAASAIQELVLAPAKFDFSIQTRITLIGAVFNDLYDAVTLKTTQNDKYYFEVMAGCSIAALALASVNPSEGDYVLRSDVFAVNDQLSALYDKYLDTLDSLYTDDPNPLNSYSAQPGTQSALQDLVIYTQSNLEELAFDAKQERIVVLEKDYHLVPLVHKFLGLDELDANIEQFRQVNKIKNANIFIVRKGTSVKYFV